MITLLVKRRAMLIETDGNVDTLPSHLTRTRMQEGTGCWDWEVANLSPLLVSDDGAFRPLHLVSKIHEDSVTFTYR